MTLEKNDFLKIFGRGPRPELSKTFFSWTSEENEDVKALLHTTFFQKATQSRSWSLSYFWFEKSWFSDVMPSSGGLV